MGTNPSIHTRTIALYRGLTLPFGCVIGSENIRCGTVSCWVRSPGAAWDGFSLPMGCAKGEHTMQLGCRALADLARHFGVLPGTNSGREQTRRRRLLLRRGACTGTAWRLWRCG